MTTLTAQASAAIYLPADATLTYYHPLSFKPQANGGIQIGDNYDWKKLRFDLSDKKRTAVRVDDDNRYFYRKEWVEWTAVLDAKSTSSMRAALGGLRKLQVDDMPLELGIQMPAALVVTLYPSKGIRHPLEETPELWTEDTAVKYLRSLKPAQAQKLQDTVHLNRNALDWALTQRQMRVADELWGMGIRPTTFAQEHALGWWALSGGYELTPGLDNTNKRYTISEDTPENRELLERLEKEVENPHFDRKEWHAPWDLLLIVWLERLQDLPSQINTTVTFATGGKDPLKANRTAFHQWLANQRSVSVSDPLAAHYAWLGAMEKQGYDFTANHADPILRVSAEEGLEKLADDAGFGAEMASHLSALVRSGRLGQILPDASPTPPRNKPRF